MFYKQLPMSLKMDVTASSIIILYILRKAIEGYQNSFDYIWLKNNNFLIKFFFVPDISTNMHFTKMKNEIYGPLLTVQCNAKCNNTLY